MASALTGSPPSQHDAPSAAHQATSVREQTLGGQSQSPHQEPPLALPSSAAAPISSQDTPSPPTALPRQTLRPLRKRRRLPGGTLDSPKSILKPSPPPQKPFSFRRDILQNINTRLAQQGVNVQVPLPQTGTAQGAANLLGGMFRRIGGMAAGAAGAALGSTLPDHSAAQSHQPASSGATTSTAGTQPSSRPRNTASEGTSPATVSLQNVAARLQAVGHAATATAPSGPSSSSASTSMPPPPAASGQPSGDNHALPSPSSSVAPLKRVQFTVSKMAVVYPISSEIPIEDEDDTRRKIEALHRQALRERQERSWTPQELEALYRDCCRVREEHPLKKMRLVFEEAARASPPALKTLDLSFLPLDRQAIDPLADLLSVDFGLSKLVLENCGLTDDGLKAILHALLISGTLPNLSLASNRRLKYTGWRYVAIFMRRARALRYLDLSENSINRASLQHIVDAIRKPPEAVTRAQKPQEMATAAPTAAPADGPVASGSIGGADYDEEGEPLMPSAPLLREVAEGGDGASLTTAVISLRLENCGLKGSSLAQLAQAVRFSDIKHISLRRNRISPMGAVALAAMLKDYPDAQSSPSHSSVPTAGAVPGESTAGVSDVATVGSNLDAQSRGSSPVLPEIPLITSTPTGGVTARHVPPSTSQPGTVRYHTQMTSQGASNSVPGQDASAHSTAVALANARRAKKMLDSMPRLGNLLTVDLKSNDIRDGVTYLAQMLKKNRTLRVLNLSDNHIDMHGLVALAEALKYNSTLETLDVSHNPCAGPALEGITTLRTAFALNSNLKRLFMNDTDLSSEGAIALAEFLPEARSLIHLDLTENFEVDIAGVMALAVSVKMNKSLRCLDLNIPPNDPDFARLSQEILQSCIRNTQLAQKRAQQKGLQQPVAAPIYKSVVARAAQEKDERAKAMEKARLAEQSAMEAAAANRAQSQDKLIDAAEQCYVVLRDLLTGEERRLKDAQSTDKQVTTATAVAPDFVDELVAQSNSLRQRLIKVIGTMNDEGDKLAKALSVTDDLEAITARLIAFYKSSSSSSATSTSTSRDGSRRNSNEGVRGADAGAATLKPPPSSEDADISSPSFSVGSDDDDDDDDDDEDEDEGRRDGIRQGVNLDTDLSRATRGLGIDDGGSIGIVAEKEPELEVTNAIDGQPRSPRSESRARTMVDEEGEVFRKAKILEMQEEEEHEGVATESVLSQGRRAHDDDDGGSDAAPASSGAPVASGSDDGAPLSEEGEADADGDRSSTSAITTGQTTTTTSAAESTPARRRSSSSSSSISLSVTAEASGEEIRRQLLEAS